MELLILICLLIIIVLLLYDRIPVRRRVTPKEEKLNPALPDIMGQPKQLRILAAAIPADEVQTEDIAFDPDSLDIEYDENETLGMQIPVDELDEVFTSAPGYDADWDNADELDTGFAQGVTFDELAQIGQFLRQDTLAPEQQEIAVDLVQKIQGTELFFLLEESIGEASQRIARLLDTSLKADAAEGNPILSENGLNDFDIGEFV